MDPRYRIRTVPKFHYGSATLLSGEIRSIDLSGLLVPVPVVILTLLFDLFLCAIPPIQFLPFLWKKGHWLQKFISIYLDPNVNFFGSEQKFMTSRFYVPVRHLSWKLPPFCVLLPFSHIWSERHKTKCIREEYWPLSPNVASPPPSTTYCDQLFRATLGVGGGGG